MVGVPLKAGRDEAGTGLTRQMTHKRPSGGDLTLVETENKGNHGGSWGACFREKGPAFKYSSVCSMVFFRTIFPNNTCGFRNPGNTLCSR